MLQAINTTTTTQVVADLAEKGTDFVCPCCNAPVVLCRGMIVTPHFKHKAKQGCGYGEGESEQHRRVKKHFHDTLKALDVDIAMEVPFDFMPRTARADLTITAGSIVYKKAIKEPWRAFC